MKAIKKERKQSSSIHQKIRKAAFVPIESQETERFKYLLIHPLSEGLRKRLVTCRRVFNTIIQIPQLWASDVDWKKIRDDASLWMLEAAIEGLTANFATHYLFGLPFKPTTILAHGIFIKQGLSIYSRIKKDGSTPTIPKKDK